MLRKEKLIWSGWGSGKRLEAEVSLITGTVGARLVSNIDTRRLRLFFHSLLWRAAATERSEFSEVSLCSDDLERLRLAILGEEDLPLSFFPIQLTQLSTKGVIHNQTPIQDTKYIPNPLIPGATLALPTYRFYIDGLIAHVHRVLPLGFSAESLGNLILGANGSVLISAVTYEDSKQSLDLEATKAAYGISEPPDFPVDA